MTEAAAIPEAIQWHEGMLLAPQHFQQLSLRCEELLTYHAHTLGPFHWGVRHLTIDPTVLVSGLVRLIAVEAIMPDGLVIQHGLDASAQPEHALELDLTALGSPMIQEPITIYLCVPATLPGAATRKGTLVRYESIEGDLIQDDNTGDGDLRIPRLRPLLSLMAADVPPPQYISLPLLQVRYENEAFVTTDFLPPVLEVGLKSPLWELGSLVAKRLREKALFLFERVRAPSLAMGSPLVLETKTYVHSLVSALLPFEAILATGTVHPFTLYLALCSLAGHVAAVGTRLVPPPVEPYDHNHLRATFEPIINLIFQALHEGIQETYTPFPMHLDDGVFQLPFERAWMEREVILGVRGRDEMSERDVLVWMETCLISSQMHMPSLRERRVLGSSRQRIDSDADLIPVRGVVFFALDLDPAVIEPDGILQILNLPEDTNRIRPAEIVLYVKNHP